MRREGDLVLASVPERFAAIESRCTRLEDGLALNTEVTQQVYDNTRSIIEAVAAAASFWTFIALWAGRLKRWSYTTAKWVGAVAGAVVALWAATKAVFQVDLSAVLVQWWRE